MDLGRGKGEVPVSLKGLWGGERSVAVVECCDCEGDVTT